MKVLYDIFMAFFRPSILSYGGGPASIPLMQQEIVERYKWFTSEQFADALAIGNTLPGPIAPKMGAYIGYNVAGVLGAVTAILATVAPTAIIIVALAKFLLAYKDSPRLQGMLKVAKPIVVVLLLQTAIEMMTKKSYPNWTAYAVSTVALGAVMLLKIHPALVILAGLGMGFVFYGWF